MQKAFLLKDYLIFSYFRLRKSTVSRKAIEFRSSSYFPSNHARILIKFEYSKINYKYYILLVNESNYRHERAYYHHCRQSLKTLHVRTFAAGSQWCRCCVPCISASGQRETLCRSSNRHDQSPVKSLHF
jgi:hypothetical protein